MGQADWSELGGSISIASLVRGVTAKLTPPNSSISNGFVWGYNSLDATAAGCHALYVNLSGFTPTGSGPAVADGGGSIRGCIKRVPGPGNVGFTPFLFFCAQGSPPSVNDNAYMLGLLDADPYKIVLAKGQMATGISINSEDPVVLETSSSQYSTGDDQWHHLRLDVLVEPNGDVLLKCFENNLSLQPIGDTPSWQAIAGFTAAGYIDDVLQIATGSPPLLGGYTGIGFAFQNVLSRRGAFDAIEVYRAA